MIPIPFSRFFPFFFLKREFYTLLIVCLKLDTTTSVCRYCDECKCILLKTWCVWTIIPCIFENEQELSFHRLLHSYTHKACKEICTYHEIEWLLCPYRFAFKIRHQHGSFQLVESPCGHKSQRRQILKLFLQQ